MYKQVLDPVGNSLFLSTLFAALPLVTLFVLLGGLRLKAHVAALWSLLVAILVALIVYSMPLGQTLDSGLEGAAFGLFPIMWIVVNCIWIYNMLERSGHFAVIKRSFGRLSDDERVQAVLIAFCFGALLEALAGFGTPVAICSVMLIALGFSPVKAAAVSLVAITAPVAFGAIAVPITTLAPLAELPKDDLGAMVGRQTPFLALVVPLILVGMVDGWRGVRAVWPAALAGGFTFAVAQFVTANFIAVEITDIVAAVLTVAAVLGMMRVWKPAQELGFESSASSDPAVEGGSDGGSDSSAIAAAGNTQTIERVDTVRTTSSRLTLGAVAPYLIIIAVFSVSQLPFVKHWLLEHGSWIFEWPGLDVVTQDGEPVGATTFKLDHIKATGTLLLLSGVLFAACYRISPKRMLVAYRDTLVQLRFTAVTVVSVLALAFVMNLSGMTASLGFALASTGALFAVVSPFIGWLGVAITGSDTSSNSLFGVLQVTAATQTGLDPVLMASANSSAGVLGKMLSPQNGPELRWPAPVSHPA